jgi:tRNA (guanine-N7-)-methyltransferase
VCVEFCSGNGQWIGEQALHAPQFNWVAVEMKFDRARKVWLKGHREKIPNLYVVCSEATEFLAHYVPQKSVHRAFVNFPDPWPKRKHAKHRLVQAPFLSALEAGMEKGGVATLATDSPEYRDQMIGEFEREGAWSSLCPHPRYSTGWASYGESFFADLWKGKGREIYYMAYKLEGTCSKVD